MSETIVSRVLMVVVIGAVVGDVGVVVVGRVAVVVAAVEGWLAVDVPARLVVVAPGVRGAAVSAIIAGVAEDVDSGLAAVVSGA
jgi:hypothetical protein